MRSLLIMRNEESEGYEQISLSRGSFPATVIEI